MKTVLTISTILLIVLSTIATSYAQGLKVEFVKLDGDPKIQMGLDAARVVDYWARKGVLSDTIISAQDQLIRSLYEVRAATGDKIILMQRAVFDCEQVNVNLRAKNTILQRDVDDIREEVAEKNEQIIALTAERDEYRKKASFGNKLKTAGITVGILTVVAGIVVVSTNK